MTPDNDGAARRAYWAEQMQAGYDLIQQVLPFEIAECHEPFASIVDAAATADVEMEFSGTKIAGDLERVFFIRAGLVDQVITVGQAMNARGWILKIEDAFRSLEMQGQLVRKQDVFDAILEKCIWENNGEVPASELIFHRAMVLIANIPKTGTHMSGSAIDISVLDRQNGGEIWRGGPYLEMSERTPMRSPFVTPEELHNRLEITAVLEDHGFIHFPFEFWHFNQGDALGHVLGGQTGPARYGPVDWDPDSNRVTPCADPLAPLHSLAAIEEEIAAAIARRQAASQRLA